MNSIRNLLLFVLGSLTPLYIFADSATPAEFASHPTWYDYRDQSFSIEGKGSFSNPIVINTAEQLAQFAYLYNTTDPRDNVNGGWEEKVVILGSDINLEKTVNGERVQWIPIGYGNVRFAGAVLGIDPRDEQFDAPQRHKVSGMYISLSADDMANGGGSYPFGLFSSTNGYIGYLDIVDADISVDFSSKGISNQSNQIGILSGRDHAGQTAIQTIPVDNASGKTFKVAFESVSTSGKIKVVGNKGENNHIRVGGIAGYIMNHGIVHSSASVIINATDCKYVGGVCADAGQGGGTNDLVLTTILDCTAHVTINSNYTKGDYSYVGGICAMLEKSRMNVDRCTNSIVSSSSMGSITTAGSTYVGGICGYFQETCQLRGCASTATLIGGEHIGGIAGYRQGYEHGSPYDESFTAIDCCAFSGHIDGSQSQYAGGICGYNEEGKDLQVNSCLFAGTMTTEGAEHAAATVAYTPQPDENVGGCYFDASLFKGFPVCDKERHSSIRGLTTEELTSGKSGPTAMLNEDDTAENAFMLKAGYYPMLVSYVPCAVYYDGQTLPVPLSAAPEAEPSTLFLSGAWLCSLPMMIQKGDAAFDFVTHTIGPSKNTVLEDAGRSVKMNSKVSYDNLPCIRISNDTAYAVANGTFMATVTAKPDRPTPVWNRPLPIDGIKQLFFTSTVDQEWDGTIGTGVAAGTGLKEDPYIIRNGAQLAYAVLNNEEGEWYKQICDITLNRDLLNDEGMENNFDRIPNHWFDNDPWGGPWGNEVLWKAQYDGDGHFIRGARISRNGWGVFGYVAESGGIANLGIVDSSAPMRSGLFAGTMDGSITNCIAEGAIGSMHPTDDDYYKDYAGGFASIVGKTNPDAVIEDCISAAFCPFFFEDVTPFVSLSDENRGKVRNCLSAVPMIFADKDLNQSGITPWGKSYFENCYWLKGYDQLNTGYTLEEICTALGSRKNWKIFKGYLPTLKAFAETDMAKLLMVPFRTDVDYEYSASDGSDNYLMGFGKQLLFEPGSAEWISTDESSRYMEADADMGVIVPVSASFTANDILPGFERVRRIPGMLFIKGSLGKFHHLLPVRTRRGNVNAGFTFVDPNARQACLDAFDTDRDGVLTLAELKAVTDEQTQDAFQTATARQIVQFPEFRFFKAVTDLSTQLNGLSRLQEISLPYALETISSDAFQGCSSLLKVTIPSKVEWVEAHPFYGSAIKDVEVDPFNDCYVSRDGILFDTNDGLVAYPNGRTGEEAILTGTISEFAVGAVYKVDGLKRIYFETEDYETVPYLNIDGIVSEDGELLDIYVSDATYESVLMEGYFNDGSWDEYIDAGKLHCYYPLKIGSAKASTMYIGFDTELPAGLTPYIVRKANDNTASGMEGDEKNAAYLLEMSRRVPNRSPVVIFAAEAGTYRLEPLGEELEPWKMYENLLNGVGRDGMRVNQGDSDRGSILTLGRNSSGVLGFFYYKGERIAPYRAYLTHNEVSSGAKYHIIFDIEDETRLDLIPTRSETGWYTLDGRPLQGKPAQRGIYITSGRKVMVK